MEGTGCHSKSINEISKFQGRNQHIKAMSKQIEATKNTGYEKVNDI